MLFRSLEFARARVEMKAIEAVQGGGVAPGFGDPAQAAAMIGPDTVDGIAPAGEWAQWWREAVRAKRQAAPWCAGTVAGETVSSSERTSVGMPSPDVTAPIPLSNPPIAC